MMQLFEVIWNAGFGDSLRECAEFGWLFATSAGMAAVPLAAIVLVINVLGRRWITSGQLSLLWCLVLVRLFMPNAPASPFSLHNLCRWVSAPAAIPDIPSPDLVLHVQGAPFVPLAGPRDLPQPDAAWDLTAERDLWLTEAIAWIWLASAIGSVGGTLFAHARFCRRLRRTPVCRDERLLRLVDQCCTQAGLRSPLPIVVFEGVAQPAVMGMLHTELLLPPHALTLADEELRMILLHELAHVRRRDLAVNWGLVVLRALHWWNPVYWLAAARYQSLREQACDAFVLQTVAAGERRDYGELLLKLVSQAPGHRGWHVMLPSSLLGILNAVWHKRALRSRLRALRSAGHRCSPWQPWVAGALVISALVCGWTDAESPAAAPERSALQLENIDWNRWRAADQDPIPDQPVQARIYPLAGILQHAEREGLTPARYLSEIESFANHLVKTASGSQRLALAVDDGPDPALPGTDCRLSGESLFVQAAPAVHDRLATLLSAWEQSGMARVCVDSRLATSRLDLASAVGAQWTTSPVEGDAVDRNENPAIEKPSGLARISVRLDSHVPFMMARLNAQQLQGVMQLLQQDRRSNVMCSPKITLFNGQSANINDRIKRPFFVGYDTSTPELRVPRVEQVDEGTMMNFQTVVRADRQHVQLTGTIELTSITDVEMVSTSGESGKIVVQFPRVRRCRLSVTSEVEQDQPLLIGYVPYLDRKEFVYVVLIARVLQDAP